MFKFANWRSYRFALIFLGVFALLVSGANIANAVGVSISGVNINIGSNGISGNVGGWNFGKGGAAGGTASSFAGQPSIKEVCNFTLSAKELKVVSKAVSCFERMFLGVVETKVKGMVDTLSDAIFAALTLYIIFFGIKVSTGIVNEQKVKAEFFIAALKVAFVSWLIYSYGVLELWNLTQTLYKGLIELTFVPPSLSSCQITSNSLNSVWASMDCLIAEFIGWGAVTANGKTEGVPLLFGMFTSSLNSGAGGAFIAMIVIMSIFSMLMSLIRIAFVYLLSMIGLILAFMISPIMIPLMLFGPTKAYFDAWWKLILSLVLQPVILIVFLSLTMGMYTEILDGPDGLKEIYRGVSPDRQVAGIEIIGNETIVEYFFRMFSNSSGNVELETKAVMSLVTIYIISYMLNMFTTQVINMSRELTGNPMSPTVGGNDFMPGFLRTK